MRIFKKTQSLIFKIRGIDFTSSDNIRFILGIVISIVIELTIKFIFG